MSQKNLTRSRNHIEQKTRDEIQKKLKIEREKDRQMVKGVFKYYEVPNGVMEFSFKKYAGDPVEKFTMYDGQVYTIPLGVAKHLNSRFYPIHHYIKDEKGNNVQSIGQKIYRMAFQSLEFMDVEGLGEAVSRIVSVETMLPAV